MTDSQQNPQPTKSASRMRLEERFGADTVVDIAAVAREEALAVFHEMWDDVRQLVVDQLDVKRRAEELPSADKAAVAPQVNDASRQVRDVAEDINDIDARQRAGEKVDPQEVQDLEERASQARESSDKASEAVESRRQSATPAVQQDDPRHGAIRRVVQEQEADRSTRRTSAPAPSQDADKANGTYATKGDLASLSARVDQIGAESRDAKTAAARALAIAQDSASSVAPLRRAVSWALITFVVVGVLYLLITGLTPLEHVWRDNFAWAFGSAFIAFCVGLITAKDASASSRDDSTSHHDEEDDDERHDDGGHHGHGDKPKLSILHRHQPASRS